MSRASQGCCRYTVLRARKKSPDRGRFIGKLSNFSDWQTTVAQTPRNLAMQRCGIAARTRHDSKRNLPEKGLPAIPAGQFGKNIRTHKPDETDSGKTTPESPHGVKGVACAESDLDIRGNEPAVGRQPLDRRQTLGKRRHPFTWFERIARRDHQPDLIETQQMQRPKRNLDMPLMRGIE